MRLVGSYEPVVLRIKRQRTDFWHFHLFPSVLSVLWMSILEANAILELTVLTRLNTSPAL